MILDDAASEAQIRAALPAMGPAAVLVTSRRSLAGLETVTRLHLDRLRRADAHQFLTRIIPAEQAEGADLARLARLCDDVPLALRIAGNRLASRTGWTVAGLTSRLAVSDHRLDTFTAGDLQLRAAVGQSYAQLGPAAQRLFRRLALVDGRTLGAGLAAALTADSLWRTEELLDVLVDVSLVQPAPGDRFALHDLHRLYARAELDAQEVPGALHAVREMADEWLLSTAVSAARWFEGSVPGEVGSDRDVRVALDSRDAAGAWLTDEAENWCAALRRAVRRGDHARVVEVTTSLRWFRLGPPGHREQLAIPA